jgi:membrane-bound lytic murein transglycosylase F
MASGSFGPTTAGRMDPYVDLFQSLGGSMIMVAKGDIDYAVCDQQIARMTQKNLPEVDILTDVSFTQLQSWAVRKDSPVLLDSLNSWLQQIKNSGLYDQIYKRYYK